MPAQVVTRTDIDNGNLKFTPVAGETGQSVHQLLLQGERRRDADSTLAYTMGVNVTADTTPPVIQSARMNGTTMVLTYNELLDESSVPGHDAYFMTVQDSFLVLPPTAQTVDGRTVRLMFANPVPSGKTAAIEYEYTDTGDDPTSLPVQDLAGNDAAVLDNYAVVVTDASGAPTILGTAQVGATLTASSEGITDLSGKPADAGDYTYQWIRENSDGSNPVGIPRATSSSYRLVTADLGKKIRVRMSFTDNEGYAEGPLTSAASDRGGADVRGHRDHRRVPARLPASSFRRDLQPDPRGSGGGTRERADRERGAVAERQLYRQKPAQDPHGDLRRGRGHGHADDSGGKSRRRRESGRDGDREGRAGNGLRDRHAGRGGRRP